MPDPRRNPLRIVELWLALAIPIATIVGLVGLLHLASTSGFTEILVPAVTAP